MNSSDDELIKIIKILGQRVGQIKTERGTLRQRQDSDRPVVEAKRVRRRILNSQGDAKRSGKILRQLFVLMSLEISDDTIRAMTDVCQQCSSPLPRQAERSAA